jgi:hypothetical protein
MPGMTDTLDLVDGVYDLDTEWQGMVHGDLRGIVAGVFPVKPPAQWFGDPGLTQLTPLTIDNTGRVHGHIAAWHTSHIGMAGGIKPPRSQSKYAFFRTGSLETDDGSFVDVGQITLAGGHASLEMTVPQAVAHYDNTNTAMMDVAAGEDRHGIWVAGALRPEVTDAQVRSIRASSVSGDWRPINGRLELVAVCAVNCPGFPIPRARVAAGSPIALVAAGVEPLIERSIAMRAESEVEAGIQAGLHTFRERIAHLEQVIMDGVVPLATAEADRLRSRVHSSAAVADTDAQFAALRSRVKGPVAEDFPAAEVLAEELDTEELDTQWDDGLDIHVPIAAALRSMVAPSKASSLRARVHA